MNLLKKIANFLLTIFVLWGSSRLLPDTVKFDNFQTIILASLIIYSVGWIIATFLYSVLTGSNKLMENDDTASISIGCLTFMTSLLLIVISIPIRLYVASLILPGFIIHGFWTYVLVAIGLCIFSLGNKNGN